MNIKQLANPPKPGPRHLFVFLLHADNLKASSAWLKKHLPKVSPPEKDWAAKDSKNLFANPGTLALFLGLGKPEDISPEQVRRAVALAVNRANEYKATEITLCFEGVTDPEIWTGISEAAVLTNYQFNHYKSKPNVNSLKSAHFAAPGSMSDAIVKGRIRAEVTCICRDLVNEPVITLNAEELAHRATILGKEYGFKTEVLNKQKIQSLKMGGLLAVNYGSVQPPTFSILEYKPKNARNKQPVVLVGKGVVFDTGGLSLKETPGSMDSMKSDMAGAAAVIGAFCGIAALKLPVHVVGLIPATDNRPGENAYTPGDVIRMFDGSTVEVLNTDAEGRMILGDALAYAKKYDPALVIDLATLTGAAIIAIGHQGTAMFAKTDQRTKELLKQAGDKVYERLVELPLWDEYRDQIKSDIADMKNVGGKPAGSITAAKFLEHFTAYPWIHLDIAGPSYLPANDAYRSKNGSGVGVRMLMQFLEDYVNG